MEVAKHVSTPVANVKLSELDTNEYKDVTHFRSLVGGLQYLTITRPDIAFSVTKVAQSMNSPTIATWRALKRILRYLQGTIDYGLWYCKQPMVNLHAFLDSDWGGDFTDSRSTTGYGIYHGTNLISWTSKKQCTVSRSSTKAEYRVVANTTSELAWIELLLREIGFITLQAPTLWCDN